MSRVINVRHEGQVCDCCGAVHSNVGMSLHLCTTSATGANKIFDLCGVHVTASDPLRLLQLVNIHRDHVSTCVHMYLRRGIEEQASCIMRCESVRHEAGAVLQTRES